jgi:hypothetical protein
VELALYKFKTKQRKKGDGELVHHGLIWRRDTPSRSLGKIVIILTSQLIVAEIKHLQIRQFDDFGRNWPYTRSRQNSEKREMVNWFTMVLFDIEIRLQDHWVQLWIYRPVSWLEFSQSSCKFVSLMISSGIGPIQSQDKRAKKGSWWNGSPTSILSGRHPWQHWRTGKEENNMLSPVRLRSSKRITVSANTSSLDLGYLG